MSTGRSPRAPLIWRGMRAINRAPERMIGRGRGPRRVVLLLTTTGRRSGLPRTVPLQYEEVDGVISVASARGPQADWFRNAQADPHVRVQIGDRRLEGVAEPVVAPDRIAEFFRLRLARHPVMMRLMMAADGVPPWASAAALERFAGTKALLIIRPLAGRGCA